MAKASIANDLSTFDDGYRACELNMKFSGPESRGRLDCLSSPAVVPSGRRPAETLRTNLAKGAYASIGIMTPEAKQISDDYPLPRHKVNWAGVIFFLVIHVVAMVGTPLYIYYRGITALELALFFFFAVATGMSITIGYHRLFAHSTFKTSPIVRFFLLLFGAATFEQSALKWSSQHRQHHLFTDTEHDPYGVNQGFWHAHIGWVLFWRHRTNYNNVKDLRRSLLVSHQHDYHAWWAVGGGFVLPMLMAWWIGHPLGGFIMAVCLRTVLVLHSSFFVNSFAHTFGKRPYNSAESARDNWFGAILTNGEGFHNFHHRFPSDYRNGVRWYHWDPSKWCIYVLSRLGLAWDLKRTSEQRIAAAIEA